METKKLLPIEVENQKEMFGGWSWNSGDNIWEGDIPGLEFVGGGGGADWGDFWRDFDPGNEYPDYGGGGGSVGGNGENNGGGNHQLQRPVDPPCVQVNSTGECTMKALGVVSKYFDGDKMGIHKDDFAEFVGINNVGEAFGTLIAGEGLSMQKLNDIIDNFFIHTELDKTSQSIITALDNNNPIFSTIRMSESIGHAVVIIGYNSETNMVTVADSLADTGFRTMLYDPNMFMSQTAISGFQNNDIVNKYKKDSNDWWEGCRMGNNN